MPMIAYPVAEILLWIWFVNRYSLMDAFLLCLTTGIVGLLICSMQARALLREMSSARTQMAGEGLGQIRFPSRTLHRLTVIFGGLFFFLPGLAAKVVGTLMILPGFRHVAIWGLKARTADRVFVKGYEFFMSNVPGGVRDVVEVTPTSIEHQDSD